VVLRVLGEAAVARHLGQHLVGQEADEPVAEGVVFVGAFGPARTSVGRWRSHPGVDADGEHRRDVPGGDQGVQGGGQPRVVTEEAFPVQGDDVRERAGADARRDIDGAAVGRPRVDP
jgi:hypothetical protein